jgi:hypothetical protein
MPGRPPVLPRTRFRRDDGDITEADASERGYATYLLTRGVDGTLDPLLGLEVPSPPSAGPLTVDRSSPRAATANPTRVVAVRAPIPSRPRPPPAPPPLPAAARTPLHIALAVRPSARCPTTVLQHAIQVTAAILSNRTRRNHRQRMAPAPAAATTRGPTAAPSRWGRVGSNHRPRDYESPALTTELRPRGQGLYLVDRCPQRVHDRPNRLAGQASSR